MSDVHGRDSTKATTWHHGLIARWWANFKLDGPEIAFFRSYVASGQPALDVGCGNGRLLVPWVADGLDVDGVDASADMIEACRAAAGTAGCQPVLYVQPTHRLDLPRRYRTIINCGAFGLGGSRARTTSRACDASAPTCSPVVCWPSTTRSTSSTMIAGDDGDPGRPTRHHHRARHADLGPTASTTPFVSVSPPSMWLSVP